MIRVRGISLLAAAGMLSLPALPAVAQERPNCPAGPPQATVVAVDGDVTARDQAGAVFDLTVGTALCALDRIETGSRSRVEFRLAGKDTTTGTSNNAVTVIPEPESDCVTLLDGILALISSVRGRHCVRTPFIDAGIEGTEAVVAVDGPTGDSFVLVREGAVGVTDRRGASGKLLLDAGEAGDRAAAFATQAQRLTLATPENVPPRFRDLLLNPEGATDWAVYYPPVLLGADVADPALREVAEMLGSGDPAGAERALATGKFAGRTEAAALALRAVTAVTLNDPVRGQGLADAAVALDPDLGAAHVARSYTLQAQGDLDAAVAAARVAVAASPDDAYAWARLAELELTLGSRRPAEAAVARSLEIGETALARAIEGFAALAASRFAAAEAAFQRAIRIDSEAPLPRLGLGLTRIRQGDVAEGRREMETAVALDPRRASLRTWLGRAYLEEGLGHKAAAQFSLAEERDPDDPNTFLFSALERFEANDPIGALSSVEQAQHLGERRGTLRGAAGLAEDRASRGAALGRIYDVLGFDQLATVVGGRAVEDDPTSPEAHYFLSDAFLGRQGFEVAQSSEFMLGQILTPPTRALVQPRLNETDLGLLRAAGPTKATFAEFSPLFMGDGVSLGISGDVGSQDAFGVETSVSLLKGPVSLAFGQFKFQTDGFLPNNFVRHDIYSLEARAAIGPDFNLFAELRHRESEWGDRVIEFGNEISPNLRQRFTSNSARAALHYRASPGHDMVAVGTWTELEETVADCAPVPGIPLSFTTDLDLPNEGYAYEARYFGRFGRTKATVGAGLSRVDAEEIDRSQFAPGPCGSGQPTTSAEIVKYQGAFGYLTSEVLDGVEATLGISFGDYEQSGFSRSGMYPKVALRTELSENFEFRAAYAEMIQRPLVLGQTVEPTTIAGFNQFFDDFGGAAAKLAAVGIDGRPRPDLWIGVSAMRRWIGSPVETGTISIQETRETTIAGYVNATLSDRWAVALDVQHERFELGDGLLSDLPDQVNTTAVPVSFRWFDGSGLYASLDAAYVHQSVTDPKRKDDGVLVGGSIGLRLANGRGVIALEGRNLLDEQLEVRDQIFYTPLTQGPTFARQRAIVLAGTFVW